MSSVSDLLLLAREEVRLLENSSRALQGDDSAEWAKPTLEAVIALGIFTARLIDQIDMSWRMNVEQDRVAYDSETPAMIARLYQRWLESTVSVLKEFERSAGGSDTARGARQFRQVRSEVEQILALDTPIKTSQPNGYRDCPGPIPDAA